MALSFGLIPIISVVKMLLVVIAPLRVLELASAAAVGVLVVLPVWLDLPLNANVVQLLVRQYTGKRVVSAIRRIGNQSVLIVTVVIATTQ